MITHLSRSLWIRSAITAIVLAIMLRRISVSEVLDVIARVRPEMVVSVLVLLAADRAVMIWRWIILLRATGQRIATKSAAWIYLVSSFVGQFPARRHRGRPRPCLHTVATYVRNKRGGGLGRCRPSARSAVDRSGRDLRHCRRWAMDARLERRMGFRPGCRNGRDRNGSRAVGRPLDPAWCPCDGPKPRLGGACSAWRLRYPSTGNIAWRS